MPGVDSRQLSLAQIKHLQRDVLRHAQYFEKLMMRCQRCRFSRLDPLMAASSQAYDAAQEVLRQLNMCEQRLKLNKASSNVPY